MKLARLLLILLCNACVFVVGVAICELTFGDWFTADLDAIPRNIPRNVKARYDARKLYPTSRERIAYTRDLFGLRGKHASVKDIDILVVGGSTTDQRYLDDEATWDAVMERELQRRGYSVTVANAGLDGQSTLGHIRSFKTWFPHISDLQPSYILFYVGINDSVYLREQNELHGSDTIESAYGLWETVKLKSVLYQTFERLRGTYKARQYGLVHPISIKNEEITVSNILDDVDNPFSLRPADAKPVNISYMDVYERNILKLAELSKQMGATAVFASQPTGTCRFEGSNILQQDDTSFSCVSLAYLNRLTRTVADQNNIPFIDVAGRLTLKRPAEMYDYIHANEQGSEMLGKLFAAELPKVVDLSIFLTASQN